MEKHLTNNRRLYPRVFDSDYYMLESLKKILISAVDRYVVDGASIFDYGCGDAPYRILFSKGTYIAGDINGNKQADVTFDHVGKVPYEDETFDVILSSQVLEHVSDVAFYLSEANRLLKDGGLLILSTHGWWTHHPYPQDLWRWTRQGLEKILTDNDFTIVESRWMIGMLAYSCQLRVQCLKGVLENKGFLAKTIFNLISACYQNLMRYSDKITPEHVGKDNAAIYFFVSNKNQF
jgi:SAM-dependent methyltransferase